MIPPARHCCASSLRTEKWPSLWKILLGEASPSKCNAHAEPVSCTLDSSPWLVVGRLTAPALASRQCTPKIMLLSRVLLVLATPYAYAAGAGRMQSM